jgi:hypothetical protein
VISTKEVPLSSDYLPAPRAGLFASSLDRQTKRTLNGIQSQSLIGRSGDRARIERITHTTELGMFASAHLSEIDRMLCRAYPEAEEEIRTMHRAGVIGIASVIHRAGLGL